MRYRYITNSSCTPDSPISSFRLASHVEMSRLTLYAGRVFYRVEIPADMKLEKYSCDNYSTTDDPRKIKDLNPVRIIVTWRGKWRHLRCEANAEKEYQKEHARWVRSLSKSHNQTIKEVNHEIGYNEKLQ